VIKAQHILSILALAIALTLGSSGSALAAPPFSGFETTSHPSNTIVHTVVEGEQHAAENHRYEFGTVVRCNIAQFHGTLDSGVSTTLTMKATNQECRAAFTFITHITFNGCHYLYHTQELLSSDEFSGTEDIVCPAEKRIEFLVTTLAGATKCIYKLGAQVGLGPVKFTDNTGSTPTDVTVDTQLSKLHYETVGSSTNCGGKPTGTYTDGAFVGETTLRGTNTGGEFIDFEVSVL
jgi:hypothetical protein